MSGLDLAELGPTPSPENGFGLLLCTVSLGSEGSDAAQPSALPSLFPGASLPTELCLPGSAAFLFLPVVHGKAVDSTEHKLPTGSP